MILDPNQILEGYEFTVRRWTAGKVSPPPAPDAHAIAWCTENARTLAGSDPASEVAAIFYLFTDRPHAFPGYARRMTTLLTLEQARSNGLRLRATTPDLDELRSEILARAVGWDVVRAWFRDRL